MLKCSNVKKQKRGIKNIGIYVSFLFMLYFLVYVKSMNFENKKLLTRLVDISRGKFSTINNGINPNTMIPG